MDEYLLEMTDANGEVVSRAFLKAFHGKSIDERMKTTECQDCGREIIKLPWAPKKCLHCIGAMFELVDLDEERLKKHCIKMKAEGFDRFYRVYVTGIKCEKVFTYFFDDEIDIEKYVKIKHPKAKNLIVKGPFQL